jgi:hypothetical protein
MKDIAEFKKYHIITIPDVHAVNCIYLNSTLLHCSYEEYPNSAKAFASKIDYPRIEIKNREFSKIDRYLTCRSLLFTKKKIFTILSSNFFTQLHLGKIMSQIKEEKDKIDSNIIKNDYINEKKQMKGEKIKFEEDNQ